MITDGNTEVTAELDETRVKSALRASTFRSVRPVSLALCFLYLVYSVNGYLALSGLAFQISLPLRLASAAAYLVIHVAARLDRLNESGAYRIGGVIAGIVLLNSAVHATLDFDPIHSTNFLFLIVACGYLFLSTGWFIGSVTITTAAWATLALTFGSPGPWLHFTIAIVDAIALAVILHVVRKRTLSRLERSLIKEERQSKALEIALSDAKNARQAADTCRP